MAQSIPGPAPYASATVAGLMSTLAQTFAGNKTFGGTTATSFLSVANNATVSGDLTVNGTIFGTINQTSILLPGSSDPLPGAGQARIRLNGNSLQASVNGLDWRTIGLPPATYTNAELGILPTNTAKQNSDAWEAAMAAITIGNAVEWLFGPGLYQFERTAELRREVRIVGQGGYNQGGTYFRWNSGNMCGIWVRASDIGEGSGGVGSRISNIRVSSGAYQAYTDGRTATADGSNVIILSGSNSQLTTGRWVIIGNPLTEEANQIVSYSGLTVTLKNNVPAGVGLAITFAKTYGIYFNGRIICENIQVDGGFYSGVYGYGNVAASTDASSSVFIGCTAVQNVQGFQIGGPDGNNCSFISCNASANTEWGFTDFSFLGNNYVGCHSENNGDAYQTTAATAESNYNGCYAEAGQTIDIAGSCWWVGGTVGDGVSAFVGAGIGQTTGGYVVGSAQKHIMYNSLGSSGYVQIGWDRQPGQIGKFKAPNSDGAEEWVDQWDHAGAVMSKSIARGVWGGSGGAAFYITGALTKNITKGNTKASFPATAFPSGFYNGGYRWAVTEAQVNAIPIATYILNNVTGPGYPINVGDRFWDHRAGAGTYLGWVCTKNGTTGTYTDGFTGTSAGGTAITLSGSNISLQQGQYITVGATETQVVSVSGTALVVADTVGAGSGLAISYTVAVYTPMARITGGGGDSTATPGNATLNTHSGRSAVAAGANAIVITNSLVSASSMVHATLQTVDATLTQILNVVPSSGSFTINCNTNASGPCNIAWWIKE